MYYLSGNKKGVKYGVVDSDDGVEDFMTITELLTAESRGYKIYGLFRKQGYLYCFGMNMDIVDLLCRRVPVPVALRLSRGLGFMQTIYIGHRIRNGGLEFVFFNDGGMSGLCILSNTDFLTHPGDVALDFVHIDSRRADVLLRRLKDSGGFVL